jgi:cytoskeletal protein CcmA (bactofilin family)
MDVISKKSKFEGTFNFGKLSRIEGKISGDISSKGTIIISKTAEILGNIKGLNLIVAGKVNGNISSENKIIIEETSDITGDLKAPKIIIKNGAIINGKINMKEFCEKIKSL